VRWVVPFALHDYSPSPRIQAPQISASISRATGVLKLSVTVSGQDATHGVLEVGRVQGQKGAKMLGDLKVGLLLPTFHLGLFGLPTLLPPTLLGPALLLPSALLGEPLVLASAPLGQFGLQLLQLPPAHLGLPPAHLGLFGLGLLPLPPAHLGLPGLFETMEKVEHAWDRGTSTSSTHR
jgi:hypothetical protein